MRARGLKLAFRLACVHHHVSRPMRARGLKLEPESGAQKSALVAPHAGAWVETRQTF